MTIEWEKLRNRCFKLTVGKVDPGYNPCSLFRNDPPERQSWVLEPPFWYQNGFCKESGNKEISEKTAFLKKLALQQFQWIIPNRGHIWTVSSLKNKFTFSGVEALAWQGARIQPEFIEMLHIHSKTPCNSWPFPWRRSIASNKSNPDFNPRFCDVISCESCDRLKGVDIFFRCIY